MSKRHWQGLMPKEGRTACGIRLTVPPSVLCFDDRMFGGLVDNKFYGMCPDCVKEFWEEEDREPPAVEAKRPALPILVEMRPKCGYIGTMYRVKQVSQCRKFAMEGSEPLRCQWHGGMK